MERIKIIAVVGPTASGKTALSVALAKRFNGEIISCDSMQIYKGMDIGTAKVTEDEACGIPHHMVDIVLPTESFSCSDYAKRARALIEDIASRGKTPIFCGGTGLYLDSVLKNERLSDAGCDERLREELMRESADELYERLKAVDPEAALKTHKNNVKRVVRALEIYYTTGRTKTDWDKASRSEDEPYDARIIGLMFRDRDNLYSKIDKRVDVMMEKGLLEEVRILDSKEFRASTASQAIGYKELLQYLDGGCTLEEAVNKIKQASRNYAKRQITWFKRTDGIKMIYLDEEPNFEFIVNSASDIINIK